MRGLLGKPYVYMVIADPMPEKDVSDIISSCRKLSGQVQAFTKATIQRSAAITVYLPGSILLPKPPPM